MWDYPRPPAVQPVADRVTVALKGHPVADTTRALRVLETSHPPVYYVPRADIAPGVLAASDRRSYCEYKGEAHYLDVLGERDAAWTYPLPAPGYERLADHVAFYPGRMDRCTVGDDEVVPQEGDFYGGWVTTRVVGPIKGAPGTWGW